MNGNSKKYIFVTGGVVSSLGKGVASASLGALLQARGYSVRLRKLDPYLNVDPGTMSPYQHGECYVTEDGAETDLDLGHYERFSDVASNKNDNITSGRIYQKILKKERRGDYDGQTVQVIPHVTNEIRDFILTPSKLDEDIFIYEVGGTVGDIESLPFLEAIRQIMREKDPVDVLSIHCTLLPYVSAAGELKTKPTQHSVKELRAIGVQPGLLICRSEQQISDKEKNKIANLCNVPTQRVIPALDVDTIYAVPETLHKEGFDEEVLKALNLADNNKPDITKWQKVTHLIRNPENETKIAVVGKYVDLQDAYKSVYEALIHGGIANKTKVIIDRLDAELLSEDEISQKLLGSHGVLVPGGFGERGTEGKVWASRIAREKQIPFLGICYGMQLAVVDFARNVLDIKAAGSTEWGDYSEPVICLMTEWLKGNEKITREEHADIGGTLRLGSYPCHISQNSKLSSIYGGEKIVNERHRHRYEVNPHYVKRYEENGLIFSGRSTSNEQFLPEAMELTTHPWFIGVQYHPELQSRPFAPHPLFKEFIKASTDYSRLV